MKKISTLLLAVTLSVAGIFAQGVDYKFNWAVSVEGTVNQAANTIGVEKAADGNVFAAMVWGGTTAAGKTVSWDGRNLLGADGAEIEGADYSSGNSYTPNMLFAKVSSVTGEVLWKVYTNFGYVDSGNTDFAATADGGAVLLVYVRQSEGADSRLAHIVGADGTVTYLQHTDADKWCYRAVLVRLDADGKVAWTRTINALDETKEGASATKVFGVSSVAVDAAGSIYVAGRMAGTLYFLGKNGRVTAVDAFNNDGWNGDSQKNVGNAFIARFAGDGYFDKIFTGEAGDYVYNQYDKLVLDGATLYAVGTCKKTGGNTGLMLGVYDTDQGVRRYYKEYEMEANSGGKQNIKVYGASVIDGSLYVTGNLAGTIVDNGVRLSAVGTKAQLDGFVARFGNDGNMLGGKTYGSVNTGTVGVADAGGCVVALSWSMADGIVATAYDKAMANELSRTVLMKSGLSAAAAAPEVIDGSLFVMGRGSRSASAAYYGTTDVKPDLKQSYGVMFGSWQLEAVTDRIAAVDGDTANAGPVYNAAGVKMAAGAGLQRGLYIQNGRKTLHR